MAASDLRRVFGAAEMPVPQKGQRLEGALPSSVAGAVCSGSGAAGKFRLAELPHIPAG